MTCKITGDRRWFYQWDINQTITLTDVQVGTQVHFSYEENSPSNTPITEVYEVNGVLLAKVPNVILQTFGKLHVYVYPINGEECHTAAHFSFTVQERNKPEDYIYTEEERLSLDSKLNKNFGVENAGKVLTVGETGEVVASNIELDDSTSTPSSGVYVPFAGKKIVAIGDSIVQGTGNGAGGFLTALQTKYPSVTTVNMGVGSTTFAVNNSVPANASEGCIFTRIDDIPSDADYIILQGGLNDFYHRDTYGVQFGEYVDNLHKYPIDAYYDGSYHNLYYGAQYGGASSQVFYQETFCGAFEMSLVKIMTRFYDKKYALLIPHDPTGSAELAKYLDAEARICKKYGFPCIDLRLSAGMPRIKAIAGGSDGASAYTVDEVHPNMEGYTEKYLPAIERWLTDGSVENSVGAITLEQVLANSTPSADTVEITVKGADGKNYTYTVYGTLTAVDEGDDDEGGETVGYTNLVPTSTDTDGSIYNGTGYKDDTRFSTTSGTTKDLENGTVTGFIEVDGTVANTIRIAGYPWITSIDYNMICAYTADQTFLGAVTAKNGGTSTTGTVIFDSLSGDDSLATVVIKAGLNIKYIRVGYYDSANADVTGANLIVTVNEEIT